MDSDNVTISISKAEYDTMQRKIHVRRGPRKGMPGVGRPMKPENRIRKLVGDLTDEQKTQVLDLVIGFIQDLQESTTDSLEE